jgi:hypothetical protein
LNFLWCLNAVGDHIPKLIALAGEDIFAEFIVLQFIRRKNRADLPEGLLNAPIALAAQLLDHGIELVLDDTDGAGADLLLNKVSINLELDACGTWGTGDEAARPRGEPERGEAP